MRNGASGQVGCWLDNEVHLDTWLRCGAPGQLDGGEGEAAEQQRERERVGQPGQDS